MAKGGFSWILFVLFGFLTYLISIALCHREKEEYCCIFYQLIQLFMILTKRGQSDIRHDWNFEIWILGCIPSLMKATIFSSYECKSQSLTGLRVRASVSWGPQPPPPPRQKYFQRICPAKLSAPYDTNPCFVAVSCLHKDRVSNAGATGVPGIHQSLHPLALHQRQQYYSLNYRHQVHGHASCGTRHLQHD